MGEGKMPSDFLRGHTDTIVLNILLKGDSYGYEIHKTIMEKTGEKFEIKEATLYSSYRRLEQGGYIVSYWGDESQGGRRKYYKITEKGKELYRQNKSDWDFSKHILDKLLEEGNK
jgi:PadR family transcriptional regulator PadR